TDVITELNSSFDVIYFYFFLNASFLGREVSCTSLYSNVVALILAISKNDPSVCKDDMNTFEDLISSQNTKLHIAITGASGSGKSAFINTFRGLRDEDAGAAPIGVTATTMKPNCYLHPQFPNIMFWDLPGIGCPPFLSDTCFQYDFLIIVASECFTENDIKLAHEIKKKKKRFYYVCTKMVLCKTFKAKEYLDEIRKFCKENLKKAGESSPSVFLISRWETDKYDFPHLIEQMQKDQVSIKKDPTVQVCSNHFESSPLLPSVSNPS
uniref:IRG-type G domain-containing protein n=1 Tax=Salvator merianae TaxID=96440 RepID=A0A8D0C598_SALMN